MVIKWMIEMHGNYIEYIVHGANDYDVYFPEDVARNELFNYYLDDIYNLAII